MVFTDRLTELCVRKTCGEVVAVVAGVVTGSVVESGVTVTWGVVITVTFSVVTGRSAGLCVCNRFKVVWLVAFTPSSAHATAVHNPRQTTSTKMKVETPRSRCITPFYHSNIKKIWFVHLTRDAAKNKSGYKISRLFLFSGFFMAFFFLSAR
jgi:pyruvate/2-oxoglutarate dehydrogenase complex dihydrolipoamide acyltransferase (E2) component